MHGAGQSSDAFAAYWVKMPATRRPVVYMTYIGLKGLTANWSDNLKAELLKYPVDVRSGHGGENLYWTVNGGCLGVSDRDVE